MIDQQQKYTRKKVHHLTVAASAEYTKSLLITLKQFLFGK